jgi:hypothetical protein
MGRKLSRGGGIVVSALLVVAGAAWAQGVQSNDIGIQTMSDVMGGPGVVPVEGEVLEFIKVGIPIAPGVSIDQKFAFDRGGRNTGLSKTGTSISFPWADMTVGLNGELVVSPNGPGVGELPNYLIPALLPPGFQRLFPFKIQGGTMYRDGAISLGGGTGLQ